MVLCTQLPMACLLLSMICLSGASYHPFRAYDESAVTSVVATSDLSDGALANSNSHGDHESESGSGGVLSRCHEACCGCVLESEYLRPTCLHPRRPSCGCWYDEENENDKLNDEAEARKSRGVEIRDRRSREFLGGAVRPDRESATSSARKHSGRTRPPELACGRLVKWLGLY